MRPGAALITGAGKRLGRAMALDLAAAGWSVAVHYHGSADAAEEAVAEALRLGAPRAAALQADLLDRAAVDRLTERATEAVGPLALLVNNASVFEMDRLRDVSPEGWDRHLDSNLWAPVRLTQSFAAQAPEAGRDAEDLPVARACVVNMIDQRVWRPTPFFLSYTLAKSALWAFTRVAAQELAPHVRVNGIGPGPTMKAARQSQDHFDRQREATLLERGAAPADIVGALRYILAAPSLTGQMLAVDGGQHLAWRTLNEARE